MTFDGSAVLVLVTSAVAIGTVYGFVTRLIVRAELARLHETFLSRIEAEKRDEEVNRRFEVLGV